jgi:hypothetical protein
LAVRLVGSHGGVEDIMATIDVHPSGATTRQVGAGQLEVIGERAVYVAAIGGALIATVADVVNNGDASTAGKLLTRFYIISLTGYIVVIGLLAIAGGFTCWVYTPGSRIDAFTRGLSILTLLSVVNPLTVPGPVGLPAVSPPAQTRGLVDGSEAPFATAFVDSQTMSYVRLSPASPPSPEFAALITLRNADTLVIVARQRFQTLEFYVLQPEGRYAVEVEADGYRRTSTVITVGAVSLGYEIPLERSDIPISVQRLYPPVEVTATEIAAPTSTI